MSHQEFVGAFPQVRIRVVVSGTTCLQLGQSGLVSTHRASSLFVVAIPQTCLHAQTWNILGTVVSALCTTSQSTRSELLKCQYPSSGQFFPYKVFVRVTPNAPSHVERHFLFSCPHADCLEGNACCLGRFDNVGGCHWCCRDSSSFTMNANAAWTMY
jgi:hypothetical protein